MAPFCAVADSTDRDRDRVRIFCLENDATGEKNLGASLGNSRTIAGEAGRCAVVRLI